MIDLSPLEVRKKKDDFSRALRGYDPSEVDSFLDLVADRLEELSTEHRQLKERVQSLEGQLEDYREREGALNEALLAAQELREEARAQAERDADLKLQEAESEAREIVREAEERVRQVREELERLRTRRDRFLRSFRGTLQRFLDELAEEERRLTDPGEEGERETGGGEEREAGSLSLLDTAAAASTGGGEEASSGGGDDPGAPDGGASGARGGSGDEPEGSEEA